MIVASKEGKLTFTYKRGPFKGKEMLDDAISDIGDEERAEGDGKLHVDVLLGKGLPDTGKNGPVVRCRLEPIDGKADSGYGQAANGEAKWTELTPGSKSKNLFENHLVLPFEEGGCRLDVEVLSVTNRLIGGKKRKVVASGQVDGAALLKMAGVGAGIEHPVNVPLRLGPIPTPVDLHNDTPPPVELVGSGAGGDKAGAGGMVGLRLRYMPMMEGKLRISELRANDLPVKPDDDPLIEFECGDYKSKTPKQEDEGANPVWEIQEMIPYTNMGERKMPVLKMTVKNKGRTIGAVAIPVLDLAAKGKGGASRALRTYKLLSDKLHDDGKARGEVSFKVQFARDVQEDDGTSGGGAEDVDVEKNQARSGLMGPLAMHTRKMQRIARLKRLKSFFYEMDTDDSGEISKVELASVLTTRIEPGGAAHSADDDLAEVNAFLRDKANIPEGEPVTADAVMKLIDDNDDASVSWEEWCKFIGDGNLTRPKALEAERLRALAAAKDEADRLAAEKARLAEEARKEKERQAQLDAMQAKLDAAQQEAADHRSNAEDQMAKAQADADRLAAKRLADLQRQEAEAEAELERQRREMLRRQKEAEAEMKRRDAEAKARMAEMEAEMRRKQQEAERKRKQQERDRERKRLEAEAKARAAQWEPKLPLNPEPRPPDHLVGAAYTMSRV